MTDEVETCDGVLVIPGRVRYLKSQQFCGRSDFRRVVVDEGVGFMEEEVFAECPALEEVQLPEGLVNIGVAAFTDCPALKTVNLPDSVKTIEDGAFLFCASLRKILLPPQLEEIRALAFQGTGLERVSVPASVKEIGEEAFFECEHLVRADVLGEQTILGSDAFGSDYALLEGYMAPGYPLLSDPPAELLYSLLWASCPDRHRPEVTDRAERFIRERESLVMERILKYNNIPAMTGISDRALLNPANIDGYVRESLTRRLPEITALLLRAKGEERNSDGEFDL